MAELLAGAAFLVLVMTGIALFVVLRTRPQIECMMAVQLAGTGGAAVALLFGAAARSAAAADVALLFALLSAFSCAAFTLGEPAGGTPAGEREEEP